jgi:hypothetical protein
MPGPEDEDTLSQYENQVPDEPDEDPEDPIEKQKIIMGILQGLANRANN